MFDVYCPEHGAPVLLDASRIEAIRNTPHGPVVDWRCWCGARGSRRGRTASLMPRRDAASPAFGAA
jgi:hypothetical protein